TRREDVAKLLRIALDSLDAQIADLQENRAQLSAMIGEQSIGSRMREAAQQKRHGLSAAGRAKISAAAKRRWAKVKKEKAETSKPKPIARKAKAKAKKATSSPGKAKK